MTEDSLIDERQAYLLYMEIVEFLHECGGPYLIIDSETCWHLVESLHNGQYVMARDEQGKISYFLDYWAVEPEDMAGLQQGIRPEKITGGSSVYALDFGFKGQYRQIRGEIAKELRKRFPDGKGIAWHHKVKKAEAFKYYPSQKGGIHGQG